MSTTAPETAPIAGDGLDLGSVASQLVVGPDDGYGGVSLVRVTLPARSHTGPRRYDDADRLVIVLGGRTQIEVEGRPAVALGPNEVLHIPRDTWHCLEAPADSPDAVELLVLSADGATDVPLP
jgi:quercetin dioxygenase-like cupin family protein